MNIGASFSADRRYRYALWRRWNERSASCTFVLLNPSTADEERDDPTIRRCVSFARRWGFGGVHVVNLFAFRATDPRALRRAPDPVGSENDRFVFARAAESRHIVLAWGTQGFLLGRGAAVLDLLRPLAHRWRHFGLTRNGQPRHPLYLRTSARLACWSMREVAARAACAKRGEHQ